MLLCKATVEPDDSSSYIDYSHKVSCYDEKSVEPVHYWNTS